MQSGTEASQLWPGNPHSSICNERVEKIMRLHTRLLCVFARICPEVKFLWWLYRGLEPLLPQYHFQSVAKISSASLDLAAQHQTHHAQVTLRSNKVY